MQVIAVVSTAILTRSGFDWWYFVSTKNPLLFRALFPAVVLGGIVPLLSPLFVLILTFIKRSRTLMNAFWALAQAAMLGSALSSFYKMFTGRIPPHLSNLVLDTSQGFQFGILRGGVFWGWPSSHTTIAFAMTFALIQLFPQRKWLKYAAFLYALYVGLGVSISIHWFSEFLAGALIGTVIGITVGKGFAQRLKEVPNLWPRALPEGQK